MLIKKHISNGRLVLAICDKDLIGKKFSDDTCELDLTSDFYKGEELPEEDLIKLVRSAYMINAVGEKTLKFLKDNNLRFQTIMVENIPHGQILNMTEF